ncbi:trigger factor [Paenibacillus swuensis]|uniref:Trigger factor n=1 Tax=Paenibacillus swuensis TaxID=1178515 RepID=A0A172TJY0_9BACL|nr:trigger factor [Paenibacillus swuensis]ANE47137.1 trigger factor [Paenibacillus swuensis]
MIANWEKLEKNQGVLTVEVDADQVTSALDKAFKKVQGKINVPGFRKGKVPRQIFEAKYGVEALYQDAIDIILPEAYTAAVKETAIEPIDRPDVEVEQFAKGQVFKFKATVEVKPEVKLGDYKGIEVSKDEVSVSDEEINEELTRLQQRHAELVVVEEGAVENNDIAIIDFDGYVDGEPFEGGKADNYSLEVGSGSFIPGFEEQVIGLNKGEEKDVEVTFPETYHAEHLAGKAATFKVKLHDIKRKNLPALDDEFAKDVSEFETLEEYKQDIVKRLTEKKDQESVQKQEFDVVEKAAANAEVEVPAAMVSSELNHMVQDFENRLKMQGMNLDLYYQFSGQNEEALRAQMSEDAQKRVLNNLVLEAIAEAEGITVSDEELDAELNTMADSYKRSAEELRSILSANGSLDAMKDELKVKKTVKYLVENSKAV